MGKYRIRIQYDEEIIIDADDAKQAELTGLIYFDDNAVPDIAIEELYPTYYAISFDKSSEYEVFRKLIKQMSKPSKHEERVGQNICLLRG